MAAPRALVASPATFTPLPYGLLSVVDSPAAPEFWQNGITFQSDCPTKLGDTTYDECISPLVTGGGAPGAPPAFAPTFSKVLRGATPFTVYVEFDCSAVGSIEDAEAAANRAMAPAFPYQVERAVWTGSSGGQFGVFPHLTATAQTLDGSVLLQSIPVTGGSATTDIADGLGQLEKLVADCSNGVAVIHVPAFALPTLDAWGLVKANGGVLKTLAGNKVAVGSGYPGTGPNGAPISPSGGVTWIYATSQPFMFAGSTRIDNAREALDRAENTIKMKAQRTVLVGWDCCHAGVQVQLGVPVT